MKISGSRSGRIVARIITILIIATGLLAGVLAWMDGNPPDMFCVVGTLFILGLFAKVLLSREEEEETDAERTKRESTLWMDKDGNFHRGGSPTGKDRRRR